MMRLHIGDKAQPGRIASKMMKNREDISDEVFHKIVSNTIGNHKSEKRLAILGYPNSKVQIQLLQSFCDLNVHEVKTIWYMKGINTIKNIRRNDKYKVMLEKHNVDDIAEKYLLSAQSYSTMHKGFSDA